MEKLNAEQKRLFDALHDSRAQDYKTFSKRDYRGVWESIVDKYPESAHFIYELLQNADDAEATEVYIILKRGSLLFKHNGKKHFDVTSEEESNVGDINSITGIGNSSKDNLQNKIGKFGVGFKSVFQYSETPEIYDDTFKFKIENYIVPTLISHDHPERKEGETLFVFPFKYPTRACKEINEKLSNLNNPILFLHNLKRVVWRFDESGCCKGIEKEYSKKILDSVEYKDDGISLEHLQLNEPDRESELFFFTKYVNISGSNHPINVGFFYDKKGKKLITNIEQKVHCFFPTKETFKTCFISHAPFLLTDNRQNLKPSEELNERLVNSIAELSAKAIVHLRDYDKNIHFLINENITEIVPKYSYSYYDSYYHHDDIFCEAIKSVYSKLLKTERIFLSRNKKYISASESLRGIPKEILSLLSQEQLAILRRNNNVDFLESNLAQNIRQQNNTLFPEIESYDFSDLASDISGKFMSLQETEWVVKLYKNLMKYASSLYKLVLKDKSSSLESLSFRYKSPIIKTQKGEWVSPFKAENTPNVYFPIQNGDSTVYDFVDKEYLGNDIAKKFFEELGIKQPDELDYIQNVVLKKYEGEHIEISDEDVRSDFKLLFDYYNKSEEPTAYIDILKQKYFLVCKDGYIHHIKNIYFYNELLEKYFAYSDSNDYLFFDIDYYADVINENNEEEVKSFLKKLGVREYPEIIIQKYPDYNHDYIREKLGISNNLYYRLVGTIKDYSLRGFISVYQGFSLDVSLYLWNDVLKSKDLEKYGTVHFSYRHWHGKTDYSDCCDSSFKHTLKCEKWVYDKEGNLVSPSEIYLDDLDSHYHRYDSIINFLELEEKHDKVNESSLIELGATEEQQEVYNNGQQLAECAKALDIPVEKLLEKLKKEAEEKQRQQNAHAHAVANNNSNNTSSFKRELNNDSLDADGFHRDELSSVESSKMFSNAHNEEIKSAKPRTQKSDNSDKDKKFEELQKVEKEKYDRTKELYEIVSSSPKYSKEWFDALIELEYRGGVDKSQESSNKAINISFGSVYKEQSGERIYVFGNPSRSVPLWIEEIGDIDVKCSFFDAEDVVLHFDVANVRDNSLRLKANRSDESNLDSINWRSCTKASITINENIDLIGRFRSAFNSLELPEHYDLKQNLPESIKFIFGPPGTGKTTNIAQKIIEIIINTENAKVLVLSPTNTGCDEVARKIKNLSSNNYHWMCRFVSSADETLEEIVADRDSEFHNGNKCCVISTMARLSFDAFNRIGSYNKLMDIEWDYIFIDEASMIPLAEIVFAIYRFHDKEIVISGDPMQIKPILTVDEWKDENIYTMVNLNRFDNPVTEPIQFEIENLVTQYRSLPPIGELFSQYSYSGKLKHNRSMLLAKELKLGTLELKPINFISFKVEKYDSIFGPKKLDNSNVHIYSVILVVETCKYIINELVKNGIKHYSIGIVCPYSPQAQLIESIMNQTVQVPEGISLTIGTVHRFQGGQCNLMFTVLNPPRGLKQAPDKVFLNNKNILNVAISRAMDCLCMFIPHRETDGFENLYELNKIGRIAIKDSANLGLFTCDQIEEKIFGKKFFIEDNTFVTSHQLANVYSQAAKRYEVRIDDNSVDIQLGENN